MHRALDRELGEGRDAVGGVDGQHGVEPGLHRGREELDTRRAVHARVRAGTVWAALIQALKGAAERAAREHVRAGAPRLHEARGHEEAALDHAVPARVAHLDCRLDREQPPGRGTLRLRQDEQGLRRADAYVHGPRGDVEHAAGGARKDKDEGGRRAVDDETGEARDAAQRAELARAAQRDAFVAAAHGRSDAAHADAVVVLGDEVPADVSHAHLRREADG